MKFYPECLQCKTLVTVNSEMMYADINRTELTQLMQRRCMKHQWRKYGNI